MIFIAEYMNFNRNRRKLPSDFMSQNFGDQYWKKYYIYHPNISCGVFPMSWLSETILSFKVACKLLKLFILARVKFFCGHPVYTLNCTMYIGAHISNEKLSINKHYKSHSME